MTNDTKYILVLNAGSSSIKFAVYKVASTPVLDLSGRIEGIAGKDSQLLYRYQDKSKWTKTAVAVPDYPAAVYHLSDWLQTQDVFRFLVGIGHRLVHGLQHIEPEMISDRFFEDLQQVSLIDPDHLPGELALLRLFREISPHVPQVACFDTAFHKTIPPVARRLPIPRRYDALGIQRYGFHGLSFGYLLEALSKLDPIAARGRVILAHLGNGASMAAVKDGQCLDTTMGFTPAGGLVMSSRSGDMDPGVLTYLMNKEGLTAVELNEVLNHQSGLIGISETSSDMQELLQLQHKDPRAAQAIDIFCYQARKWIGSLSAVLGGLDTLVFSGGIGENATEVRTRICEGLQYLGLQLEEEQNQQNKAIISPDHSPVTVRVIRTNEEWMLAKTVCQVLHLLPAEPSLPQ